MARDAPMPRNGGEPVNQQDLLGLAGYNLKRAYMAVHVDFRATLEPLGLTQRSFSVLSLVVGNPGISQSDMSRALGIERSGTVVIVDELETRDLIERRKLVTDRRAYALQATEAGEAHYARALKAVREHEDRAFAGLSAAEMQTLCALLGRVHVVTEGEEQT